MECLLALPGKAQEILTRVLGLSVDEVETLAAEGVI